MIFRTGLSFSKINLLFSLSNYGKNFIESTHKKFNSFFIKPVRIIFEFYNNNLKKIVKIVKKSAFAHERCNE
jgi:hypothetical protein